MDAAASGAADATTSAAADAGATPALHAVHQLPSKYRGVLLDQFGVLHDGAQPYPGAIEAVAGLAAAGVRLLIISNSSRRSAGALGNLARMGFDPACFHGVVTSGEVAHRHLTQRPDAWWRGLGTRCLHLTWGQRGAISLEGLGLQVTTDADQAEFILAHGTEALGTSTDGSSAQPCSLDGMKALLDRCAARAASGSSGGSGGGGGGGRSIPMVVANPDIVTVAGSELRVMPGTLARHYAAAGGEVWLAGKPAPVVYAAALDLLELPADQVVAIGDSLEHDVGGAAAAGIDSVFVLGGIHREDVGLLPGAQQQQEAGDRATAGGHSYCRRRLAAACAEHGAAPTYVLPYFSWQ